jgi:hypothetical protein
MAVVIAFIWVARLYHTLSFHIFDHPAGRLIFSLFAAAPLSIAGSLLAKKGILQPWKPSVMRDPFIAAQRLSYFLGFCLGLVGLSLSYAYKDYFQSHGMIEILTASVLVGVGTTLYSIGKKITWRSEQRQRDYNAASNIRDAILRGEKPVFALFLRPFFVTGKLVPPPAKNITPIVGASGEPIGAVELPEESADFETTLEEYLRPNMALIALGECGEAIGAGRIESSEQDWKSTFEILAQSALAILLIPSERDGTFWEIEWLKNHRKLVEQTILICPPNQGPSAIDLSQAWQATGERLRSLGLRLPPFDKKGFTFALNLDGEPCNIAVFDKGFGKVVDGICARLKANPAYQALQHARRRLGLQATLCAVTTVALAATAWLFLWFDDSRRLELSASIRNKAHELSQSKNDRDRQLAALLAIESRRLNLRAQRIDDAETPVAFVPQIDEPFLRTRTPIRKMVIGPKAERLITIHEKEVDIWDLTQDLRANLLSLKEKANDALFLANGQQVATATDSYLHIWNVADGSTVAKQPVTLLRQIAASVDGQQLAVLSGENELQTFELNDQDWHATRTVKVPKSFIQAIAFDKAGLWVAVTSNKNSVRLVHAKTGSEVELKPVVEGERKPAWGRDLFIRQFWVSSLLDPTTGLPFIFSIFTAEDGSLSSWSTYTGQRHWMRDSSVSPSFDEHLSFYVQPFTGSNRIVVSDARRLVPNSVSYLEFDGVPSQVLFHPDGRRLVLAINGLVRMEPWKHEEIESHLCASLGRQGVRQLSAPEWDTYIGRTVSYRSTCQP